MMRPSRWMLSSDNFDTLNRQIDRIDVRLAEIHKTNAICRLLATIPGIGPITATAFAATVPDPSTFRSGREFAAWLGLTPRQNLSGGKHRLGGITNKGIGISAICWYWERGPWRAIQRPVLV